MKQKSKLINLSDERLTRLRSMLKTEGLELSEEAQIPRREGAGPAPLSYAQQRIYFEPDPHHPAYNVPYAFHLDGRLDIPALEASLNEIIRRHEILRTNFVTVDGRPAQLVADRATLSPPLVDLSALPEPRRSEEARRLADTHGRGRFDLANTPLIRGTLLRLEEQRHALLLTVHHIISDGWATSLFILELSALYGAFLNRQPSPLPEPSIQYADYAAWEQRRLREENLAEHRAYWKRKLGGNLPTLNLPLDRPRTPVQSHDGAVVPLTLNREVSDAAQKLSRVEGVSLFMLLLAAFQTLLYKHGRREDIVVGTPVANRTHTEVERLLGCFVNFLVLRTDLSGDPPFRELLKRVRKVCLDAYAHQDFPFVKLIEELQPERDLSRPPLFQVMFELVNTPIQARLEMPGVNASPMAFHHGTSEFEINVILQEREQGLGGWVFYRTALFDATTIARLFADFKTLLERVVAHPEYRLSEFSFSMGS